MRTQGSHALGRWGCLNWAGGGPNVAQTGESHQQESGRGRLKVCCWGIVVYETLCHDTCLAQNAPMSLSDSPVFQNTEMETIKKRNVHLDRWPCINCLLGETLNSSGQQPESALKKTWPEGMNNRLRIIAPPGPLGDFLFFFFFF